MTTRKILLSLVLAFAVEQMHSQTVFYPLAVGTKWQWSLNSGSSSYGIEIVGDTLLPNGHRYSIIPAYWSMPERWERQEVNRVYRYSQASQQEWLLFDFSKSSGDTINLSPLVVLSTAKNDTLFGATRRIWSFAVGFVPGVLDAGAGYIITDSIGLTGYSNWNSTLRVVGARVGSRTYGTITRVFNSLSTSPTQIQLYQSYPNPFNGQATIEFYLAREANVTLQIIDIAGRIVSQLANDRLVPGQHHYVWDAGSFSSGVYYCELIASNEHKMIRLAHIK